MLRVATPTIRSRKEERNGSEAVVEQYVFGPNHVDELLMVRGSNGTRFVYQGERSDRERVAIGKANKDVCVRPARWPEASDHDDREWRANWNVLSATTTQGTLQEENVYSPYGQVVVRRQLVGCISMHHAISSSW